MNATATAAALATAALLTTATFPAHAQESCGGDLGSFLAGVKQEAVSKGVSPAAADAALAHVRIDPKVLAMDRGQAVFKQTFLEFSKRAVNSYRMSKGKEKMARYADVFARAEKQYGVPAPVITAFWGLETDYGAVQGNFNTMNALVTMAHDCRRPDLFRPQLIAAVRMAAHGDIDPQKTTGAWAGEIGQVQMLPQDIVRHGVDGDGDGHVRLKESEPDVIMTAANFIHSLGWHAGEPWLQEVEIPDDLPWAKTGLHSNMTVADWQKAGVKPRSGSLPSPSLPADLIMPQGRKGPTFLAYPNYSVYLEWNKSFIYTTTAAYFATRLAGAPPYDHGNPAPGLSNSEVETLQRILQAKGYDVGEIDGIIGGGTRDAVRSEQLKHGMPADGWPTQALLSALR
ncbi:MAG: lytic murein transglycosylase [Pararhizobium sp.]